MNSTLSRTPCCLLTVKVPVGRIRRYLKRGRYADTIQQGAALYMSK